MAIRITVEFPAPMKVRTYRNPAAALPGQYVFWYFNGKERPDVQIEFFAVQKLVAGMPDGAILPTGPTGFFDSLDHSGTHIVGKSQNSGTSDQYYRFYYYVLEGGERLQKTTSGDDYIGGIDVPVMPPPITITIGEP